MEILKKTKARITHEIYVGGGGGGGRGGGGGGGCGGGGGGSGGEGGGGGGGGGGGDVPHFQHKNRTSRKDKTDKHRISEMMRKNGRRQNEEKKYVRVLSPSPCHDKDHTSMLGIDYKITHKENLPT